MVFELEDSATGGSIANIKVIGVGGAGGNVVNNMIASQIKGVEFVAINTDSQALESSLAAHKVHIGAALTRGLGAGMKPDIGRDSALEDRDLIARCLEGADMVFITAGMGGGTGTGASPVVAEVAKEMGALTVAVVTRPFTIEGGGRRANAERGISELQGRVDALIIVPNDKISLVVERGTPILKCFEVANDVLRNAVTGISDLILGTGLVNLDFADVKTIMENKGRAVIGMGVGKGEKRSHEAAKRAILNPLIENNSIEGARGILVNVTGGLDLSLSDIEEAVGMVHESADPEANIVFGAVIDPDIKDEMRVTVIATGFKDLPRKAEIPAVKAWNPITKDALVSSAARLSNQPASPAVAAAMAIAGVQESYVTKSFASEAVLPQQSEVPAQPGSSSAPESVALRASGRLLSKSLAFDMGGEDTIDIPTFLRKPLSAPAGRTQAV